MSIPTSTPTLKSVLPTPSNKQIESAAFKQITSLTQQLCELQPKSASAIQPEEGEVVADDSLALAMSLAYRLCALCTVHAPDQGSSIRRIEVIWESGNGSTLMNHIVNWLDEASAQQGHALAYIFVRLLAILVNTIPRAGRTFLQPPTSDTNGSAKVVPLLTGMLRLAAAPLMLRELIDLVAAFTGVSDTQRLAPPSTSIPSSSMSTHLDENTLPAERCVWFSHAFLSNNQGRSVLLLAKHVSHPALSEHARTTLLCILLQLCCPAQLASIPKNAQPLARTSSSAARKILSTQWNKWAGQPLPEIQSGTNVDARIDAENEKQRNRQVRLLRQLRVVLELASSAPVVSDDDDDMRSSLPTSRPANAAPEAHPVHSHTHPQQIMYPHPQ
jgi:hypothetical protein